MSLSSGQRHREEIDLALLMVLLAHAPALTGGEPHGHLPGQRTYVLYHIHAVVLNPAQRLAVPERAAHLGLGVDIVLCLTFLFGKIFLLCA